jgi:hypothetical protein
MSDPAAVLIAGIVLGSVTLTIKAIASAAVRYRENELKYQGSRTSTVTEERLERMEHAIDAIAVEIERISEGQRFTTKLLSERTSRSVS